MKAIFHSLVVLVAGGAIAVTGCSQKVVTSDRNNPNMSEAEEVTADARDAAAPVVAEMDPTAKEAGRDPDRTMQRLMGIAADEASDQLHEGEEVKVQISGAGPFARITKIDPGIEDEVMPENRE